jgi:hypothetical protein
LPFWLAGILTVAITPFLVRRYTGRRVSCLLAWLLALSPVLVYFSRFARPYAFTCLLGLLAVFSVVRWWENARWRWAVVYVLSATGAIYLHMAVLPFVLTPLLLLGVEAVWRGRSLGFVPLLRLAVVGAALCVALALVLMPPFVSDGGAMFEKIGSTSPGPAQVADMFRLIAGANAFWPGLSCMVLALAGWVLLLRKDARVALILGAGSVLQVIVSGRQPAAASGSWVLLRYSLAILPTVLLLVSVTIIAITDRVAATIPGRGMLRSVVATGGPGLICISLFLAGPLPMLYKVPNNWFVNELRLRLLNQWDEARTHVAVTPFYEALSRFDAGTFVLAEAPWRHAIKLNHLPLCQHVHRQATVIGFTAGLSRHLLYGELPQHHMKTRFRVFVDLADRGAVEHRGIDYVVFHKDLRREFSPVRASMSDARFMQTTPDVSECIAAYIGQHGVPTYEDEFVTVFAVSKKAERVRIAQ